MSTTHRNRPARSWHRLVEAPLRTVLAPVQFVGFWSAVVLPLVLVPMLLTGAANRSPLLFAAIVVVNVLAAVTGRNYNSE